MNTDMKLEPNAAWGGVGGGTALQAMDRALTRCGRNPREAAAVLRDAFGEPVHTAALVHRERRLREYRSVLDHLLESPGIAQRTPEWYAAREGLLTASDIAQALGQAKFGTRKAFYQKKCLPREEQPPFDPSIPPLKWGIMFEPVACRVYRALNAGVKVNEFGLLRHREIDHLGASPDGITEHGVMLEIKCPWRRKIDGGIPVQYYYQIQGQLEVCGLHECDYFECAFEEWYPTNDDLRVEHANEHIDENIDDEDEEDDATSDPTEKKMPFGVFLEVIVSTCNESVYAYPPEDRFDAMYPASVDDLRDWLASETNDRIEAARAQHGVDVDVRVRQRWWRLKSHNVKRVLKDDAFVENMLGQVRSAWDNVLKYRADRSLFDAEVGATVKRARAAAGSAARSASGSNSPTNSIVEYAFGDDSD
jgi:putative phage-type endonuclease